ncbi:MAG: UDP-N-acetylglucosamine--N-acetylmuramyl-(pentapeptide) pyrophosphoryl-undecaprenol N-acetylglucosamine transferase [bacterium]|nr:UDP-N-acetylglucosamine--N-acetylmuramyl-(pentapeptide) pyrophosphoryl-undecaprenol N-acetylglucosamine transferase [bacterium]
MSAGAATILERPTDSVDAASTVVFAGGGTGGHVFPALAVAEAVRELRSDVGFVFFSTNRAFDRSVLERTDGEWIAQSVRPLRSAPWTWPRFYLDWRRSCHDCRREFSRRRPAVVVGTGGFASGPPVCEADRGGIPTILLNPDAVPGRANRFLARRARRIFVQWPETLKALRDHDHCEVTGCPIRAQFRTADRSAGLEHFGLDPARRTLLVTGASQGATSINRAMVAIRELLAGAPEWQILHLTGQADLEPTQAGYEEANVPAKTLPFTHRMADALVAADLIVSRAGASTLAEITALGKPAVLLPYPYHRDMHQQANARVLVKAGAARIVHDRIVPEKTAAGLREVLPGLMSDADALARMAAAARRMGTTNASGHVAQRICELIPPPANSGGR